MPRGLLPFSIGTIRERRPLTLVFIAALARPLFGSFMPDTGHQQKSSSYRRSVNEQNISVYLSEINVTVMNTPYFIRLFFSVDWIDPSFKVFKGRCCSSASLSIVCRVGELLMKTLGTVSSSEV